MTTDSKEVVCERDTILKDDGWGYKDSFFYVDEDKRVRFTGDRYDISGKVLPHLKPWMTENMGIDLDYTTPSKEVLDLVRPKVCVDLDERLVKWLRNEGMSYSIDLKQRVRRSHGHTVHDIWELRHGYCGRIPDIVVWPENHQHVVDLVDKANEYDCVIIPFGGGTSVSTGLRCAEAEVRTIISLDLAKMSRLLWIDDENLLARAEAGIVGIDLEHKLNEKGYTLGHEPDSIEFSTLGGWVATRASGMKKNKYGNIEDLLVHVTFVTSRGVLQKSCEVPRLSAGPDIHHFILGSEGTLGVVTEVSFKVFPKPECKKFGSVLFPAFQLGVQFLREVARQKCAPASVRLVDNEQFRFGQALKPESSSYWTWLLDQIKKLYVTKWRGFNPMEMCSAIFVFEGTAEEVVTQEKRINNLAVTFGGLLAGEENGRYGYMLTYSISYLRDLGFEYSCLGESFETSIPWDRVLDVCRNVKQLLHSETKRQGILYPILASCRVTQLYDTGACVYFYFGFNYRGLCRDPLDVYDEIETAARNEILACGGSISHHHGVGKLRKSWLPQTVGQTGLSALRALKSHLDPGNVFANGNLFDVSKL